MSVTLNSLIGTTDKPVGPQIPDRIIVMWKCWF